MHCTRLSSSLEAVAYSKCCRGLELMSTLPGAFSQGAEGCRHHDIWKYFQDTRKTRPKVLQVSSWQGGPWPGVQARHLDSQEYYLRSGKAHAQSTTESQRTRAAKLTSDKISLTLPRSVWEKFGRVLATLSPRHWNTCDKVPTSLTCQSPANASVTENL